MIVSKVRAIVLDRQPRRFIYPKDSGRFDASSYVYGVFGAQRSRDCTVTVLVSQIKRGHVTAL